MEKYFKEFNFENQRRKKKVKKIKNMLNSEKKEDIEILKSICHSDLVKYNYTVNEYKDILKLNHLKFKLMKKNDLRHYCTNMYYLIENIKKIQRCWRNYFIGLFNKTLGPSYRNYKLSNNIEDFLTAETLEEIDYYYYMSFKDKDNFVYSFNIVSL